MPTRTEVYWEAASVLVSDNYSADIIDGPRIVTDAPPVLVGAAVYAAAMHALPDDGFRESNAWEMVPRAQVGLMYF